MEIGVLGPVVLSRDDRPVHVGGARQRALLVRLVLARGNCVPTSVLVDDLWRTPAAGDALKTSVNRLRRVVGPGAIVHNGTGYALLVDPTRVDAYRFEAGVARARALRPGHPAPAATCYGDALALWRGRALGDVEEATWARPEIERLEELRLAAIEGRFEALLATGAAGAVVADLAATVREYPWRERLTAQLMVALYRCGRQREALEAFDHLATALREELGLEPSPTVRELERSILAQDPLLDPPARFDGTSALVGVQAPRSFIGRVAELEQLDAAVRGNRVVTIVGAGGTGKTRLADQLLQRRAARYREGACFVELGTVRAGALVADHIASRLGLVDSAETGPVDPADLLAGFLREREMLLVLDGCEAVPEVVSALVLHLHAQCPDLRIVATSREHLRLDGVTLELGPMTTPRTGATGDELSASDAVRLYLARNEQLHVDPTPADLAAIGELTRLVGGNPLAIELVARLTGAAAPTAIVDRAREMLVSVANGSGPESRPGRSVPLRTTLALSHEQLEPAERLLFRRAGVFAAGFGVAALEAVAGFDGLGSQGVAPALRSLETAALVYPTGTTPDRRRMLDRVRDEALDRLRAAGELEATLGRQTTYYLQLAQRCDRALRGHGQDEARDTLDLELDNLRDVLARLLAAGAGETAACLTAALTDFWYLRGHWAEARRWVDRSVDATAGTRSVARARMLRSHANRAGFSGMHDRMTELDEALSISREHDSREDEVWTLLFMASAAGNGGDHARMRELLTDADWIIDQLDDPWMRAVRCSYVAATDITLDPSDAHDAQLRAHRELLALGDRAWAGRCLWFAGSIARRRQDLTTAEAELELAIELTEAAGDRAATAHARASLTRAAFARNAPRARALFDRSIEELAAIGDSHCADKLRAAISAEAVSADAV